MRVWWVLVLILGLNVFVNAQACGYTFLTIYLKDSTGNLIKNAKIETFDKDFKENDNLDYPRKNQESYDSLAKVIDWREKKQAYFGSEGICGGHRNVGLRITSQGFDIFEKVIDLPLGWTSYSVKLRRNNVRESTEVIDLTHFSGKVIDENQTVVASAKLEMTAENGKKYFTNSDSEGWYEFDLPFGKYIVKVSQNGFNDFKLVNFNLEENRRIYLDLTMKVRSCSDCKNSILGREWQSKIQEVILDYQKIKENNKQ